MVNRCTYSEEYLEVGMIEESIASMEKLSASIAVGQALSRAKLISFYKPIYGAESGYVIYIEDLEDLRELSKELHALFPGIKRIGNPSTWSPYADKAIVEWAWSYKGLTIKAWIDTTVDKLPRGVFSPTCQFTPVKREDGFTFVCAKGGSA